MSELTSMMNIGKEMENSDDENSSLLGESICMERSIYKANYEDLREILQLQYLSYQSEADLFGSRDIPPLKQTLDEVINDYNAGIILKMIDKS